MSAQRIILCGFGKVGQAFAQLLHERRDLLRTRHALGLDLIAVVDVGATQPWHRAPYQRYLRQRLGASFQEP
jgi:homoserine dehydrogenase